MDISLNMNCKDGVCHLRKSSTEDDASSSMPLPSALSNWLLYGATWCSYCTKAKEELIKKAEAFTYVDVDAYGGGTQVKDALKDRVGNHNTIPMIFFNQDFVGGYSELLKYKKRVGSIGETKPMCASVKEICDAVRPDFEKSFGKEFETYVPHSYKTQVVAGLNYFVKIEVDPQDFAHARIYKSLQNTTQYVSHVHPKGEQEEIEYF